MFTGSKIYKISPAALKERISYKTIGLKARHRREIFGILELPEAAPPGILEKIAGPMEKGLWKHWPEPVEDVEMKPEPTEDVVMKSEPGSEEWVGLYHNIMFYNVPLDEVFLLLFEWSIGLHNIVLIVRVFEFRRRRDFF